MFGLPPDYAWTYRLYLTRLAYLPLAQIEPLSFRWFAELVGESQMGPS